MPLRSLVHNIVGPSKSLAPAGGADVGASALTLRYAGGNDAEALARLAQLDSSRPPRGVVLMGEVAGEPWAAVSLDDGHSVADPFRPSAEVLWLLLQRARELRRPARGRPQWRPRAVGA